MTMRCAQFQLIPENTQNNVEELELIDLFDDDSCLALFLKQTLCSFDCIKTLRWTIKSETFTGHGLWHFFDHIFVGHWTFGHLDIGHWTSGHWTLDSPSMIHNAILIGRMVLQIMINEMCKGKRRSIRLVL
eukprot:738929_1